MQDNWARQHGGRDHLMMTQTGGDFWLELTGSSPPIVDRSLRDIFECPLCEYHDGYTAYRGPARDVNGLLDADAVGADLPGNHGRGEGGNVLRKSGDVMTVVEGDLLWRRATETTKP